MAKLRIFVNMLHPQRTLAIIIFTLVSLFAVPLTLMAATPTPAADPVSLQQLSAPAEAPVAPIPFSEIGAKATADYQGDAIGIEATEEGARLRTGFQKLAGTVTAEGLRLDSTAEQDGQLKLTAAALRRGAGQPTVLSLRGSVTSTEKIVTFTRLGLIEEYSVSVDGLRQDFIVTERPAGAGDLSVELALTGAAAEAAGDGARLTLAGSGRVLAYSRLHVTDAKGKELTATMEVLAPDRLAIRVQDAAATYPLRIDPTFSDANWVSLNDGIAGANGIVHAAVVDGSGNLYIGGDFTLAGTAVANYIAKWDGSVWSALGSGMDAPVQALAVSGTELYAGGWFSTAGGVAANRIAKWDGSVWSALGTGMEGGSSPTVSALFMSGTVLYAGGFFTTAGGVTANGIAKWDGSAWSALGSGMNGTVSALAVMGTDLYAGGGFSMAGGVTVNRIAKWDGSAWSALGTGVAGSIRALAVMGTDLYVGGNFTTASSVTVNNIAKWDGNAWSALGTGMNSGVWALAVVGTDLYAGGSFSTAGGAIVNNIAIWDGDTWAALGTGINSTVTALAVHGPDLYAGGWFTTAGGVPGNKIAKWNSSAWSGIGTHMDAAVLALAVSGTDIYIGGNFTFADGVAVNRVAKWNGSGWSALGSGMNGGVFTLAVSGTDLYAGGGFTTAGGVTVNRIAKWDGNAWAGLGTGMDNTVRALAVIGTDLYAGGNFNTAGGGSANNIAKWDGSAWSALGSGMNGGVFTLAVSGTDLYAGGLFATASGVTVNRIAKWDGNAWSALGMGMDSIVYALAVSGTNLYAGGAFTTAGGVTANRIAKWDGSGWSALGTGMDGGSFDLVGALAVNGPDLYAGGIFTTAGGLTANNIAKWNGSAWSAFGTGVNERVTALAVCDSNLFVGGSFSFIGTTTVSPFIAQIKIPPTVTSLLPTSGTAAGGTEVTITGNNFTGATAATFGGTAAASFTVDSPTQITAITPAHPVGAVSVEVTTPSGTNTSNELFTFTESEMVVTGNGQTILNGDATPSLTDGTDFGSVGLINAEVTQEFTISNNGIVSLNLTGAPRVAILGDHPGDFKVTMLPDDSIEVGANTAFAITLDPRLPGLRTAVVSIANDDPERDPFTFAVSGFGGLSRLLTQKIAFTAPGTVYLGEGAVTLVAEASSGLPVALDLVSGPATLVGSVLTPSGAGRVTLRATQSGGGNYAAARAVTRVITVKADPTGLTLTRLNQRYDGTPKTVGTVGAAGVVSYQVGGVFGPNAPTAAGQYAVQAIADGVTRRGTLVITKAPLYVVPEDKRKFAGALNPALTMVYEGFIGGDNASVLASLPTLRTTAKTTSPGGVYPIIARGGAAANYALIHRQGNLVVESYASGYEALLVDATSQPAGKLNLTVAKSGRSFSGNVALAGETRALRVSGPLVTNSGTELATGQATVLRNGVTYAVAFTLQMNGSLTGEVKRDSADLATTTAGRRLLVLPKGGRVNYSGIHTAVLEPAQPAGAGIPAGAGWARAVINPRGAIALAGKLGDGTAFTTRLLPDTALNPGYRLWIQPYRPARAGSFLGGFFDLSPHSLPGRRSVSEGGPLSWAKAERTADKSYPLGFAVTTVGLRLDPWILPTASQSLASLLSLSGETITVQHSATGSASDADLPTIITLSTRNLISVPGLSNPTQWKTRLNTKNGTFTGSFELLDAGGRRVAPFSGVLRQPSDPSDALIGDGQFLIPATPGAIERVSGEVLFEKP